MRERGRGRLARAWDGRPSAEPLAVAFVRNAADRRARDVSPRERSLERHEDRRAGWTGRPGGTIEEYRRTEAGPLENNLIDELVGGELDRQEFLQRAGDVRAVARRRSAACSPTSARRRALGARRARDAVKRGGTLRVGITVFGGSLEPYLLNEGGSLAFAGIPAEYLTFTNPQGRVAAVARDELEAERQRDRVDVPDPAGA